MLRQIQMRANLQVQLVKSTMGFSKLLIISNISGIIDIADRRGFYNLFRLKLASLISYDQVSIHHFLIDPFHNPFLKIL